MSPGAECGQQVLARQRLTLVVTMKMEVARESAQCLFISFHTHHFLPGGDRGFPAILRTPKQSKPPGQFPLGSAWNKSSDGAQDWVCSGYDTPVRIFTRGSFIWQDDPRAVTSLPSGCAPSATARVPGTSTNRGRHASPTPLDSGARRLLSAPGGPAQFGHGARRTYQRKDYHCRT